MKQFTSIFILSCLLFTLSSFDYQTVYSHRNLLFETSYHEVEAILIDSVKYNGDSIIYPSKNIQIIGDNCSTPYGASWIGSKIIINKKWNYFFNDQNDTIKIKTDARLKESWDFFKRPDITITASVEKWDTITLWGIKDSLKTIVLHVFDMTMKPLPHKLDGKIIEISKHFGLVSAVNFIYMPALRFIQTYNVNEQCHLVGLTNPKLGIQNLTWFQAFDFQVGDEFHTTEISNSFMAGGNYYSSKTINKILSRDDFNDSIHYKIELEILTQTKQNSTSDYVTEYKHFQKNVVVRRNELFDKYPGVTIVSNDSTFVLLNIMKGESKSTNQNIFHRNSDACWQKSMIMDDACNYISYQRGFGLFYSSAGCWPEQIFYEYKHVYYKKGATTWGVPLILTGINQPETHSQMIVYPNPTNDKIFINSEILTEPSVFELLDLRGLIIQRTVVDASRNLIKLANYSNGMYFYRLINNGKLLKSGKIVKQ